MKLVRYIAKRYIIYAIIILLVAIPVFYFSIQYFVLNGLDENMQQQKDWIAEQLEITSPDNFVSFDNEVSIEKSNAMKPSEDFSTQPIYIAADDETVMHRVLISEVIVKGNAYKIIIKKSMIEDEDLLNGILVLQFLLLAILLLGLFLINYKISRTIWTPFNSIVHQLNLYRVNQTKKYEPISTDIEEFEELNLSIQNLIHRNTQLFNAQKEFTENASHELQTPIAVMQSKIELLMQTNPLSQEQSDLIEQLYISSHKIQRLNRALLMLAKIENRQFPDTEEIEVNEVAKRILGQYEDAVVENEVELTLKSEGLVKVTANKTLVDIMLGNLISNALRYTSPKGKINIEIGHNYFKISNSGTKELDTEILFQRFKKQSSHQNSIGLGLEMVRKIASLYGYTIDYAYSNNFHVFTINFKM